MNHFDDAIKRRAAAEPIILPAFFEARSDSLLSSLRTRVKPPKRVLRPMLRFVLAAVLVVLLLIGGAYAAYTLSGGDYFKELFRSVAQENTDNDYGYMNTDQLDNMVSSTVGRVVDTDDLSIDVLGVIVSGNTALFDVKVTAKKLETVLYDTGIEPLMNYRFHDFGNFFLLVDGLKKDPRGTSGSIEHIYSDKDKTLAPNQFIIRYSYVSEVPLRDKTYIMTYRDFGYFDFDEPDQFRQLYSGEWSFNIVFDPASDTSRTVLLSQSLSAGNYDFTIDSVEITPLTCTVLISNGKEYFERLDDRWEDVWKALYDKADDFSVNLADGTKLDSTHYMTGGISGGAPGYELVATFNVPVSVSDVVSITLGGIDIPLE